MHSKAKYSAYSLMLAVLLTMLSSASLLGQVPEIAELRKAGLYGRVHEWGGIVRRRPHRVKVDVPRNAPIIISDYHSRVGANGYGRGSRHKGVDIFAETGSPIIAAADGRVIKAQVDRCWGPTLLVSHGKDKNGKRFYGLYGHVRNIKVKVGQRVKRGQQIAEMGENIFTTCGAGLHHLHFQISYNPKRIPIVGWGWANFVRDGASAPNPHNYWLNGKGKITCFEEGKKYPARGLTYPVPCSNDIDQNRSSETMLAQQQGSEQGQDGSPSPLASDIDDASLEQLAIAVSAQLQSDEDALTTKESQNLKVDASLEKIDQVFAAEILRHDLLSEVPEVDEAMSEADLSEALRELSEQEEVAQEAGDQGLLEREVLTSGIRYFPVVPMESLFEELADE